jgi:hypothetical protein
VDAEQEELRTKRVKLSQEEEEDEFATIEDPLRAVECLVAELHYMVVHFFVFEQECEGPQANVEAFDLDAVDDCLGYRAPTLPVKERSALYAALLGDRILGDAKLYRAISYRGDESAARELRERLVEVVHASGVARWVTHRCVGEASLISPLHTKAVQFFCETVVESAVMYQINRGGEGHYGGKKTEKMLVHLRQQLADNTRSAVPHEKKDLFVRVIRERILLNEANHRHAYYRENEGGRRMVREVIAQAAEACDLVSYILVDEDWFPGWYSTEEEEEEEEESKSGETEK